MRPEDLAKTGSEHGHQSALMLWSVGKREQWPEIKWLYAIPNGGDRHIAVAAAMKAEGVKPGVSDLCLPVARRGYHGFYCEMKKPGKGGNESDDQKKFGAFLVEQGYFYCCCDHWELAAKTISWYLGVDDGTY